MGHFPPSKLGSREIEVMLLIATLQNKEKEGFVGFFATFSLILKPTRGGGKKRNYPSQKKLSIPKTRHSKIVRKQAQDCPKEVFLYSTIKLSVEKVITTNIISFKALKGDRLHRFMEEKSIDRGSKHLYTSAGNQQQGRPSVSILFAQLSRQLVSHYVKQHAGLDGSLV